MRTRRHLIKTLATLGVAAMAPGLAGTAQAQAFPNRPIRIITPFPPGSGPDAALRVVGERLSKAWAQPVVIENKPGGSGFIAVSAFKQGAGDDHTLIQLDNTHTTTHPHTFAKLPYEVEKDFVPLAMMLRTWFFVAVGAASPYKTVDDIVEAARNRPNQVKYGSWFVGSPGHIGALRLQALRSVQMLHVPYRDFGQLYAAVANQEVDWALGSIASAGGLERAGKLRFIALAGPAMDPQYPAVPATAEQSQLKGFEMSGWAGLFAAAGTSAAMRDRLAADIAESLTSPEASERYKQMGFEAPRYSPGEFSQLIQRETIAWGGIIRSANLRLD